MKLIVDINPFIERNFHIDKFDSQREITANYKDVKLNDGSIDVLKILRIFSIESKLMTFIGGDNGKIYEELLRNEGIDFEKIKIRDEIQEKVHIASDQRTLDIKTEEPRITMEEVNELYSVYSDNLNKSNFVIIPESSETLRSSEFLENLINISYKAGVKIGVVTNKNNVKSVIDKKSYLVVLGMEELEEYSNQELNFEWEISKIINGILGSGVGILILIRSDKEMHLYNGKELLIATYDSKDSVKIDKNKALSGYIAGISKGYEDAMNISISLAAGKDDSSELLSGKDVAAIKMLLKEIKVDKFNA